MDEVFRKQAKAEGFTDQEIDEFLGEKQVIQPQPTDRPPVNELLGQPNPPIPEPTNPYEAPQGAEVYQPKTPDFVDPFTRPEGIEVTQLLGERPEVYPGGHKAIDTINTIDPTQTNTIGGFPFTGYQEGGYGNYLGVIGSNQEEASQTPPEERDELIRKAKEYISSGAQDLSGMKEIAPGKYAYITGHKNSPVNVNPEYVATGSARMTMGNTGFSDGDHSHDELLNPEGNFEDIQDKIGTRYPLNTNLYGNSTGVEDYNNMVKQELQRRINLQRTMQYK